MPTNNNNPQSAHQRANAQAKAYKSAFATKDLELTYEDGRTETIEIPPHPDLRMLPDERLVAYEALLFEAEQTYDREPDLEIPEQRLETGVVLPKETRRGAIKVPQRITTIDEDTGEEHTELVQPPWAIAVVIACLGEDTYEKIRGAGKSAADVWRIWNESSMELASRRDADPFPARSARNVAAVR